MSAFFQNDNGLKPFPTDFINAGYMLGDEVDMTDSGACSSGTWQARKNNFPSDGRLFYANFGKGVMFWQSNAGAACWVNSVNVPSVDVYWFTDGNACGSGEGGGDPGVYMQNNCHNAVNYGYNVSRVRSLVSPARSKPVWNFVEIGCPWTGTWGCITPAQTRAATWHSYIAGARSVTYFAHSFKAGAGIGTCGSTSATQRDCPAVKAALTSLNAEIQGVASALNGQTITSGFSSNGNIKALGKWDGSNFYILAGATPGAGSASFSIPCIGGATVTVLNEGRTIPMNAGSFSDGFANDNTIHLYRIDGGSDCGL